MSNLYILVFLACFGVFLNTALIDELQVLLNFSNKHSAVLKSLAEGALVADEICRKTKIPKSRIYTILNELIELRLLRKSDDFPAEYSLEDLSKVVNELMHAKYEEFVKKERKLLSLLEDKGENRITLITESKQLSFEFISGVNECTYCKVISRHYSLPFVFYPDDEKAFLSLRQLFSSKRRLLMDERDSDQLRFFRQLKEAWVAGKKFEYIVNSESLFSHFNLVRQEFGNAFLKNLINTIKERLSAHKNLSVYVVNEVIPMHIEITDYKVVAFISNMGYISGASMRSKEIVQLYQELFEDVKQRAKPIEEYFKLIIEGKTEFSEETSHSLKVIGPVKIPILLEKNSTASFSLALWNFGPNRRYIAVKKGNPSNKKEPLVRIESSCIFGHVFGSRLCDCKWQLEQALKKIDEEGDGLVIYAVDQEARGNGLDAHFLTYENAEKMGTTPGADVEDKRTYEDVAEILKSHGISSIRLLTNYPKRAKAIESLGIKVKMIPLEAEVDEFNKPELLVKKNKLGQLLTKV